MILYVALALILVLAPYPQRVQRLAVYLCLGLAALFGLGGASMIVTYRADGLLVGSVFLALAGGFLFRAYWARRAVSGAR